MQQNQITGKSSEMTDTKLNPCGLMAKFRSLGMVKSLHIGQSVANYIGSETKWFWVGETPLKI
jgi:hypothetical protein